MVVLFVLAKIVCTKIQNISVEGEGGEICCVGVRSMLV